ncbi:FadR/GntR family transcriptional regulator [Psychromarinibacter halotolerans]|uniref:FadR/GntR family transcriptional regulator n=1 Tax=Psychromarinibacter halotolerans TaxID=1775175 RepID=A0ABV7GVL9_9RHOB|nr:FadR/GntR family transcriptional regulator [Psychromarinibacter halotolerans]MDF0598462.1 FadR/GntR family transcriptional regulator [Psychromarinibacter halotolerans]
MSDVETILSDKGADRVIAYFNDALMSGELKIGDKLKSERDLSRELDVGRPLLREVIRSLSMLGMLDVRHGSGTYVRQANLSTIADFFTFCLAQQQDMLDDVMEARIGIECQAIRLACTRANEVDLARIGQWFASLTETLDDPDAGGRADFMFHRSIVAASHSSSLITLYGALSELLQRSHVQRRKTVYHERSVVGDLVEAHREVFLSIVAKDPEVADRRLREHFAIGDELRRRSLIDTYRKGAKTA